MDVIQQKTESRNTEGSRNLGYSTKFSLEDTAVPRHTVKNGPTERESQGLPRIFMSGHKVIEICDLPALCCYIWLSSLLRIKEYKLCNSYSIAECRGK